MHGTRRSERFVRAGADGSGLVVVLGRGSVAESRRSFTPRQPGDLADAYPAARFLPALAARATSWVRSTWDWRPECCPGRVSLEAAKDWYGSAGRLVRCSVGTWSRHDAGCSRALADGSMKAVMLVGADPIGDFPDAALATTCARGGGARDRGGLCPVGRRSRCARRRLPAAAHHETAGDDDEHRGPGAAESGRS